MDENETVSEGFQELSEIDGLRLSLEILQENWDAAAASLLALRAEDENWLPFGGNLREHDGFTVHHMHLIAEKARFQTKGNPLLKRGLSLRTSYVWGRGIKWDGDLKPRHNKLVEANESVLFNQTAFASLERSLFTNGNLFMGYRRSKQRAFPIPFREITNFATNPDLLNDIWYWQRSWYPTDPSTGAPTKQPVIEWYPVWETYRDSDNRANRLLTEINGQPVNPDVVVIDVRVNRDIDEIWGVPDVLPAMPYAWAHAEYLKDGSKLLKALSTIAWKVVSKSKGNATTAGAKIAEVRRSGTTAAMTADTDLVAMPKSGQVDLGDGDRIASYVAAALGVSLTALLSTAGAAGGSFGAEASLDTPQENEALARQAVWRESFFDRMLEAMGFPDTSSIAFRSITADPEYRSVQTLTLAFKSGAIFQDEYRKRMLDLSDIEPLHETTDLPKPNGFTGAQQTNIDAIAQGTLDLQKAQLDLEKKQAADQAAVAKQNAANQVEIQKHQINTNANLLKGGVDPSPSQGNTGGVGKMNSGDNTLKKMGQKPGTSSVK